MKRISKLFIMAVATLLLVSAGEAYGWGWGGSCGSSGGYGYRSYGGCCGGCYGSYGGGYSRGYYGGGYGGGRSYYGGGRSYYGGGRSYYGGGRSYYSGGCYGGRGYYGGGYYGGRSYYGGQPYNRGYRGYYGRNGDGGARRVVSRPVTAVASTDSRLNQPQTRATLNVEVPAKTAIYVNGNPTKSTGQQRVFLSQLMKDGATARFEVRAVVNEDGQTAEETQVVMVKAGRTGKLSFDLSQPEPTQTSLILNVPTDASVQIEGREIAQKGPRRVLTSQRVSAGKLREDVTVRVSLNRNGRTVSQEQKINLLGGRKHELTFEFDHTALAKR